jgi:hypothetical protein
MEEARVGYAAISALRDMLKESILTNTRDNLYEGDLNHIRLYQEYTAYLTDSSIEKI